MCSEYVIARTAAKLCRDEDENHIDQDPKVRWQKKLDVLMSCFALSLHPRAYAHVVSTFP